jgi:hypothetical protein
VEHIYPNGLQDLAGYNGVHGENGEAALFSETLDDACSDLLLYHFYTTASANRALPDDIERQEETFTEEVERALSGKIPNRNRMLAAIRDENSPPSLRLWKDFSGVGDDRKTNGDLPQTPTTVVELMLIGGRATMVIATPFGPLTPSDAKLIARAIFFARGLLPVLLLGSLTGFSPDPLSMRNRQLTYGATMARAIVEFSGPIVVVNMGRMIGGAFVVLSKQLNPSLRILAVQGSQVQVVGGGIASRVVYQSKIRRESEETGVPVEEIEERVAAHFDEVHTAERALRVGSIDGVVKADSVRKSVIEVFNDLSRESD